MLEVVTLRARPDLLPGVADWLRRQFWGVDEHSAAEVEAIYAGCVAEVGAPQTFVLLENGVAVGTATLARHDLEERPDLTPWLAGVFVVPQCRGRGLVTHLLHAFDAACAAAGIPEAWLYTHTAERVYLRAGWAATEVVARAGAPAVTLMRRRYPGGLAPATG